MPAIKEVLDQCKDKGCFEKLRTIITSETMQLGHSELVAFLQKQVTQLVVCTSFTIQELLMHMSYGRMK